MRQTFALEASPFWKRNRIHERNEVRIEHNRVNVDFVYVEISV